MILRFSNPDYPQSLKKIKNPPKTLYVEGDITLLNSPCLAIVGTRKPTEYGKKIAEEFSKYISNKGICIVSGLARRNRHLCTYWSKMWKRKNYSCIRWWYK